MTDPLFAVPREPVALGPGAVVVPGWMDERRQRFVTAECARWAAAAPPVAPVLRGGGRMTARMTSLGRRWTPGGYRDGAPGPAVPDWLRRAARLAVDAAAAVDPRVAEGLAGPFDPDAALLNLYGPGAAMGLHQDRDEGARAPVVSLSLGDAAVFRFGTPEHRGRPYTDVTLESGDLVVFGGPSRLAFHGVARVHHGSGPSWVREEWGGDPGRINLTIRRTR